jgi:hypothetical protein
VIREIKGTITWSGQRTRLNGNYACLLEFPTPEGNQDIARIVGCGGDANGCAAFLSTPQFFDIKSVTPQDIRKSQQLFPGE